MSTEQASNANTERITKRRNEEPISHPSQ